jgi:hypothetical protein
MYDAWKRNRSGWDPMTCTIMYVVISLGMFLWGYYVGQDVLIGE